MNIDAYRWALSLPGRSRTNRSGLSSTSRFVLVILAGHCVKRDGLTARPSTQKVAEQICSDVRTVERAIADLKQRGLVTVTPQFDEANGRQTSNVYTLTMVSSRVTVAPVVEGVTSDAPTPSPVTPSPRHERHPPPVTGDALIKEMGNRSGQEKWAKGNGQTNSQPERLTGSVSFPTGFVGVVPETGIPELQELIAIWNDERWPGSRPVCGNDAPYALQAWDEACEYGDDVPDPETFRRMIRLCARRRTKDSFRSILKRTRRWQDELDLWQDDADADAWWDPVAAPDAELLETAP